MAVRKPFVAQPVPNFGALAFLHLHLHLIVWNIVACRHFRRVHIPSIGHRGFRVLLTSPLTICGCVCFFKKTPPQAVILYFKKTITEMRGSAPTTSCLAKRGTPWHRDSFAEPLALAALRLPAAKCVGRSGRCCRSPGTGQASQSSAQGDTSLG